jgi:hypothetical protein
MSAITGKTIPLWVKIAFTAFVVVLVPFYWKEYGPTNFLYFCDVALLMTLVAVWTENPIWASMPAVGILLPQAYWMVDFLSNAVGLPITDMTSYMFDKNIFWFARFLSLFHFWLPIMLVWLVARLGYDRRAFLRWTLLAWAIFLVCYFFLPPPPAPTDNPTLPVNVNYVHGFGKKAQKAMPPLIYLGLTMLVAPIGVYWPTHWALNRLWGEKRAKAPGDESPGKCGP